MENKMTLLYLRSLSNEQAMEWLIKNYPLDSDNYYMVFYLIPHLSWKKKYRRKLAEYYFAKLPFASDIPFTSFLKIMPPHEMLKIIDYVLSNDKKDLKRTGFIHIAFSVGSKEKVDELTEILKSDGYEVISGPRTTGDGYYESCIVGIEGNQIEITI